MILLDSHSIGKSATEGAYGAELALSGRNGQIRFVSSRANSWLREYFQLGAAPKRLPCALRDWLEEPVGKRGQYLPFFIENGKRQLVVTIMQPRLETSICLLLEVRPIGILAALPPGRKLTPKQSEVLMWLARGKSNGQSAEIIERKSNTVAKHLQEIYNKLGVDSRSGAIAFTRHV